MTPLRSINARGVFFICIFLPLVPTGFWVFRFFYREEAGFREETGGDGIFVDRVGKEGERKDARRRKIKEASKTHIRSTPVRQDGQNSVRSSSFFEMENTGGPIGFLGGSSDKKKPHYLSISFLHCTKRKIVNL